MYWYKPKNSPRWYEIRKIAAHLSDMAITGQSFVRIDPRSVYKEPMEMK